MAEEGEAAAGGASRQGAPSPATSGMRFPGDNNNISYILRIGKALLVGFIRTLMQQHTACQPQVTHIGQQDREDTSVQQHRAADLPHSAQVPSLQECMLRIWREVSNNPEITRMVQCVAGNNPLKVLADVSEHTFATGINWGRIVVFFYFAFKVIEQSGSEWFDTVINWALTFLQHRLAAWIQEQGGWLAMLSYNPLSSRGVGND